MKGAKN